MSVKIKDLNFEPFISENLIQARIVELANRLTVDYHDKAPMFISVLNGSFMFTSDLMKSFLSPCQITFIKLTSYQGMESTGIIKSLIGLSDDIKGRHVVLIEDIIDTGYTIKNILEELVVKEPASIKILTLLLKPTALQVDVVADYVGFEIENKFVVGYGLDYDGYGRNLNELYILK